jgi:hypothetical protein
MLSRVAQKRIPQNYQQMMRMIKKIKMEEVARSPSTQFSNLGI